MGDFDATTALVPRLAKGKPDHLETPQTPCLEIKSQLENLQLRAHFLVPVQSKQ